MKIAGQMCTLILVCLVMLTGAQFAVGQDDPKTRDEAAEPTIDAEMSAADFGGTSWQFVKFQDADDITLTPDDKSKYTIAFAKDGTVNVRFDCNRGHGTWKSTGSNQIEFGPMALTRAVCPPGSLHDQFVKNWGYIRSFIIKDGHLFLSLTADGGVYEFEPMSKG